MDNAARAQAIEYRRQLLRIVSQIERDYDLGKYEHVRLDAPILEHVIDTLPEKCYPLDT